MEEQSRSKKKPNRMMLSLLKEVKKTVKEVEGYEMKIDPEKIKAEFEAKAKRPARKVKCPRCNQEIYEYNVDSHHTAHMNEILPGWLWLGNAVNARNLSELEKWTQVTHILNMATEVKCFYPDKFKYRKFELYDFADQDISSILEEAVDWVEEARKANGVILVHCVQGMSRSTSIVIGYLMKYKDMSFDDAFKHVKARRSIAKPNKGFERALRIFGTTLKRA